MQKGGATTLPLVGGAILSDSAGATGPEITALVEDEVRRRIPPFTTDRSTSLRASNFKVNLGKKLSSH